MSAQRARRAYSAINIVRTAGASAAASVRVDSAQRAMNRWPSPISSSREVIAQIHPDSTALGKSHGRRRGGTHDRVRGDLRFWIEFRASAEERLRRQVRMPSGPVERDVKI